MCSCRPAAMPPRGDVVAMTNDRANFQMTDFVVGDRLPVIGHGTRTFGLRW